MCTHLYLYFYLCLYLYHLNICIYIYIYIVFWEGDSNNDLLGTMFSTSILPHSKGAWKARITLNF